MNDSCQSQKLHHCPYKMKLSSQSDGITPQLKTASACCLASLTSSPAAFRISATMPDGPATLLHFILLECFGDQGCGHVGRGACSCRDHRELVAWPLKFNIEQPSIAINPPTLDAALLGDVPLYYIEKHVKQTFLVDTYHHKFNHGFRKKQAILQIINSHV